MAQELWIKSTRNNLEYKVLSYNKETKMGTLIGSLGMEFEEELTKERLEKYGYVRVIKEVPDVRP